MLPRVGHCGHNYIRLMVHAVIMKHDGVCLAIQLHLESADSNT